MRRPGTLPNSGTSGHRPAGHAEDGSTPLSVAGDNCPTASARLHYSNQSLRRTQQQSSHLSSRDADKPSDRAQQSDARLQNGIPGHHHGPPPLPSRHQSTCAQSSYPTLPINGHAAHQYHHFPREKERFSSRERSRDRDAAVQSAPHRTDKHRELQMEMEMRDGMDMGEIGTYRA